jgi:hypothetical protein
MRTIEFLVVPTEKRKIEDHVVGWIHTTSLNTTNNVHIVYYMKCSHVTLMLSRAYSSYTYSNMRKVQELGEVIEPM